MIDTEMSRQDFFLVGWKRAGKHEKNHEKKKGRPQEDSERQAPRSGEEGKDRRGSGDTRRRERKNQRGRMC
jgi:hypothetical protein